MNVRTLLILAVACGLVSVIPGQAQPPDGPAETIANPAPVEPNDGEIDYIDSYMATPQGSLQIFASLLPREPVHGLARLVVGANPDRRAYVGLEGEIANTLGSLRLRIDTRDLRIAEEGDTAKATVTVVAQNDLGMTMNWQEKLELRRGERGKRKVWRIVPQQFSLQPTVPGKSAVLQQMVDLLAHPAKSLAMIQQNKSMGQVKQLALGVMQLMQDYDDTFKTTPETFKADLMPYIFNEGLFTAPDAAPGTQSFAFNAELAGRPFKVEKPHEVVMIYLGSDGKLDFRYDGKTIIGFADGSVRALTEEQVRVLRWKP